MPFVLDASVTLAWCFKDEDSAYANAVRLALNDDFAKVPNFWAIEVANGLRQGERRGRLSEAEVSYLTGLLLDLNVSAVDVEVEDALGRILSLARVENLTVYDASYLDLAMYEGLPLATLHDDLIVAAQHVGVPRLNPL